MGKPVDDCKNSPKSVKPNSKGGKGATDLSVGVSTSINAWVSIERIKLMFNKKILIVCEYLPPYITGAYNRGEFYLNFFPNYFKENIFIASNFNTILKRENYSMPEKANVYRILLDNKAKNNCKFKKYFNIIFKKNKLDYYSCKHYSKLVHIIKVNK